MKRVLIFLIKGYRLLISSQTPPSCRFEPTCSQYAIEAIEKRGVFRGVLLAIRRLLRCGPWHPGGYDPVP
ncbi:membrane protein insertion efficiency factor YidD [Ferroacidibacillus organovorans]|uniref:Putative membrane protein insertion efficiency factor n=1 Tax=Ferroacidibacillus organovorans TaxID=1765683 RepID=A0A162TGM5_9BACL|nr:membrane protein insertion efficiency factor YidD [Ferroacidibacillus organovorans]KYP80784.1 membrane protein insertion efficiency factor YidD [Ferroacidibacillus organovorans]OAG93566.1 membrane protein insertion efficiency factor [Ferroacidibacillus organovorans]OPG16818.1 membrane protein insertion efficiency factor YidD [Ferroacidibacillus organovorans]